MALADGVPGVSGGTVAFLLGFYDKFIQSIHDILVGTKQQKKAALCFLFQLGIGWIIGFCGMVFLLNQVFDRYIYQISSLFLGFIVFAIPMILLEEKETIWGQYKQIGYAFFGAILVVLLTYGYHGFRHTVAMDLSQLSVGFGVYLLIAGMVAISAMVLPGISGSTLLLIFGLYVPVMQAVKGILTFQLQYFGGVFLFGCGILVGIFCVTGWIQKALQRYRSQMIYFILGLMIGSLYAVVMGPTTLKSPQPAMQLHTFHSLFFVLGAVVILGLKKLEQYAK